MVKETSIKAICGRWAWVTQQAGPLVHVMQTYPFIFNESDWAATFQNII